MAKKKSTGGDVEAKKGPGAGRTFKKTDYGIDAETFVSAWERSSSVDEVYEALKQISEKADRPAMPKPIILARASEYRHVKVPLKKMPRSRTNSINVEALTALVMKIREETQR